MAVTIVGQASAAATSIAIPAHQAGDMILIFARGTAAAPTFPNASGTVPSWQQVQSNFGFSLGTSVGTFVATAATTTSGTWTNALHMCVLVLRPGAGNKLQTDVSMIAGQGANNTQTLIYPALVFQILSGSSFGVRCGMRNVAITAVGTPPTGWTAQSIQPAGASALMAVHTRTAITVSPVADTVTVTSSNSAYRCVTIEVQEVTLAQSVGVTGRATAQAFGAVATKAVIARAVGSVASAQAFGTPLASLTTRPIADFAGVPVSGSAPLTVAFTDLSTIPSAGPSSTLLVSYTPGTDRNDFSGAVGVRLGIGGSNLVIDWWGVRCNGYGGTRTIKVYEWFSGVVQHTFTIDYTGKAAGEYVWTKTAPFTMLANGYYAVLMDVTASDGMWWKNPGPTTFKPGYFSNIYDSYYSGGLATGSADSSFIGLDFGWT